ncbi:LPS translocon maturation chaperone LptM [Ottowia caeni]|uniref:LPS translocon maturation chaperone LptM n=1 Tax=Ottowia caeni TaxID=2870339 RepID=UPI003D72D1A0|nr:lipoprotein [Ottowia caeni]
MPLTRQLPRILATAFVLPFVVGLLAACGQKGPLFIPATAPTADRATLPQTVFGQSERASAANPSPTPVSTPSSPSRPRALPNLPETQ